MPQTRPPDSAGIATLSTTLQLARQRFFEDGSDPQGAVPELIARSWRRCLALPATLSETPEPLAHEALFARRDAQGRLRRHALPELEALAEALSPSRVVVLLADPQGMILDAAGSDVFMNKAQRVALMPGVEWSEVQRGTNAIGTALTELSPITVLGHQHYLEQNGALGCTAAPLLDSEGQVLGVLDVSGDARCIQAQTVGLVRMAAQMIEYRMALDNLPAQTEILRFAHDPALIGSHREALLWIRNETIVGANRAAMRVLGMTFDQLRGRFVDDLFSSLPTAERDPFELCLHPWLARPGRSASWASGWVGRKSASNHLASITAPERTPQISQVAALRPPIIADPQREAQLDRAVRVLDCGIPVLILGESGVGKEVFARQVHQASQRCRGPFVAVNCAAVPEGLIEAELFGYEEGAFTGARRKGQPGQIREAHGGVLFLDEIGDMPLSMQARLLRVLQDHEVKALGGGRRQSVDFALVCATHRDLKAMAAEGSFRTDLYYRLQHFVAVLPALREHAEAKARIDELLQAMLPSRKLRLGPQAREALLAYTWPGNWRQLVAVAQTLLALAEPGSCIELADLPDDLRRDWRTHQQQPPTTSASPARSGPERDGAATSPVPLRAMTESAIHAAIASCSGNVSRAARLLGVHRSTLYRHVRK
uniref:Putative Acetoin catabolism regulatory protein AcoR n=1 Tax=mine drainage metagenome TaxID=410659 RepID=E6PJM7_9ZZZZ